MDTTKGEAVSAQNHKEEQQRMHVKQHRGDQKLVIKKGLMQPLTHGHKKMLVKMRV